MTSYFIAPDAEAEPTLWRGKPDESAPVAVITRRQLGESPEVWALLAREYPRAESCDGCGRCIADGSALCGKCADEAWDREYFDRHDDIGPDE